MIAHRASSVTTPSSDERPIRVLATRAKAEAARSVTLIRWKVTARSAMATCRSAGTAVSSALVRSLPRIHSRGSISRTSPLRPIRWRAPSRQASRATTSRNFIERHMPPVSRSATFSSTEKVVMSAGQLTWLCLLAVALRPRVGEPHRRQRPVERGGLGETDEQGGVQLLGRAVDPDRVRVPQLVEELLVGQRQLVAERGVRRLQGRLDLGGRRLEHAQPAIDGLLHPLPGYAVLGELSGDLEGRSGQRRQHLVDDLGAARDHGVGVVDLGHRGPEPEGAATVATQSVVEGTLEDDRQEPRLVGPRDHAAEGETDLVAVRRGGGSQDRLGDRGGGVLAVRQRHPETLRRHSVQHQDRVGGVEDAAGPLDQELVSGAHGADLGVAGDTGPGRAVPPGQRAGQLVARLVGLGLQQPALTGQHPEVRLGQPAGEVADVLGDRLGPAEGGEVRVEQGQSPLDRPGQGLAVEQREVLEEVQPAALVERLVGQALTEDQMGARSRATRVYPEAQDTIDLGLADTSHEVIHGNRDGRSSWRFRRGRPCRPAGSPTGRVPVAAP